LIAGYWTEYEPLAGDTVPDDIAEIIAHFSPSTSASRAPLQRPLRVEHFVGRQRELAQLLADLQPGKIVTLCGPGGIGKSALAAEAIWTLCPNDDPPGRFPDGIITYDFYNQPQARVVKPVKWLPAIDPGFVPVC